MKIQPVILCGGGGTRLWPLSRTYYPKQFLMLEGSYSLLQKTVLRFQGDQYDSPILLAYEEHRFFVAEQMAQIGVKATIILEPCLRNTAASLAVASYFVDSKTPLLFLPSDHEIEEEAPLHEAVKVAFKAIDMGGEALVVFGVRPTSPETGYGYIIPTSVPVRQGVYGVDQFVEKPDVQKAHALIKKGSYWNSGMFLGQATTWRKSIETFLPHTAQIAQTVIQEAKPDLDFIRLSSSHFSSCPSISIDEGVMEKVKNLLAVPLENTGWTDLGGWDAVAGRSDKDVQGNGIHGDVVVEDVSDSYIRAEDVLVSVIGLKDVIVVATKDAVLVAKKGATQKVKEVTAHLRNKKRTEADFHKRVYRPWGFYQEIDAGTRFKVKRLMVKPQAKTSLQIHHHRAEHWVVVSGTATVELEGKERLVHENESVYIPSGASHSIENPGKIDLHLIEVQTGAYLGEDDIVRLTDIYGRCP